MKKRTRKELEELLKSALQGKDISRELHDQQNDVFEITMDLTGDGKRRIEGREASVEDYQQWVKQQIILCRKSGRGFFDLTMNI